MTRNGRAADGGSAPARYVLGMNSETATLRAFDSIPRSEVLRDRLIVGLLLLLAAVPVGAGVFRLTQLSGVGAVTVENARFFAAPTPVVLHIVGVTLYSVLGAFQFSRSYRRSGIARHRATGWVLVVSGMVAATTWMWMTATYDLPSYDGALLGAMRYFFGSAMVVALVLGAIAASRREFGLHGAWMLRAYAIAMGAGTQVLTSIPLFVLPHLLNPGGRAWTMGAGWLINVAVAEWIIHRSPSLRRRRPQPAGARFS